MKRKFIRPLWQRTVAMTMAMLLLAGTAYSEGLTSHASATDLWEDTAESSDQGTHDLENSLFDNDSDSGFSFLGDEDSADESDDLFSSDAEDLFASERYGEDSLFAEEEPDPVVSASAEDVTVSVTGSSEIMDGIETVSVQEMGEDRVAAWQEMFNAMDDGDTKYVVSAVYDITLTDWYGNETEPNGDVTVSLTGEKVANGIAGRMDLQVYHGIEEESDVSLFSTGLKRVSEDVVEEMAVYEEGMDTVVFDTDSFSEYALVLTGNATQQEVAFGKNEYLELDKYIQKTGELNGQNAYDVYLEQAYYDPNPGVKLPNAPLKSDFFLVLDHSASMSDYPVVRLNQALDNFLNEMQIRNKLRVQRAANGEYYDIDPASVADFAVDGSYTLKDVATLKSVMGNHLMYLTGAVKYNNHVEVKVSPDSKVAVYTDDDRYRLLDIRAWENAGMRVEKTNNKGMYGSGVLLGWPDYGYSNGGNICLQDMTRTDHGTRTVYNWIMNNRDDYTVTAGDGKAYSTARVVLATDGAPAGYGDPDGYSIGKPYDYENGSGGGSYMYWDVSPLNANDALGYINAIKNMRGSRAYVSYVNVSSDPNAGTILANLEKQYGNKTVPISIVWNRIINRSYHSLTSIFMILYSQCAVNGEFIATESTISDYTVGSNSVGYTPTYFKYFENAGDIPKIEDFIAHDDQVAWQDASDNSGYASISSYVLDEITDPFEITSITDIRVYAVPRIPTNLDNDGRPRNMFEDYDDNGAKVFGVPEEDFRWGERVVTNGDEVGTEWVDVTSDVTIEVTGNKVKVSGYNYEANAVSVYDKDQFRRWPTTGNGTVYKTGDYGYKLVVIIPINAKFSFGGNGIKTNNTDISGFYPSVPTRDDLPKWEENTPLNPGKNEYMELYPEVTVDLNMYYDVTSDNATIYAPQTQKLHDLVTDPILNSIWYADPNYSDLLTLRDNAKMEFDLADKALKASNDAQPYGDEVAYQAWIVENSKLVAAKNAAAIALQEAQANLETVHAYIPDGLNNAFVNIDYQLIDPKGVVVGTLTIPHGKAYVADAQGKGNIDWVFNEGVDAEIKLSGIYTVKATVTPVTTTKSPSWHVYTEADNEDNKAILQYASTSYSPTGSSASGSQSAIIKQKTAVAKIFQLKIKVDDSKQEINEVIDFADLNGTLRSLINDKRYNKHIISYEWVCTDPTFAKSNQKDEPGVTGVVKVGSDVNFTATVPQQAVNDGLVKKNAQLGIITITAPDGAYVPADVLLTRQIGNLNKDADSTQDRVLAVMSDADNKYGPGVHSVIWEHVCTVITDYDCNHHDFAQAHKYDGADVNVGDPGKVRFIVHVMENPNVTPSKTTTTPAIPKGADIKWEVSAVNNDTAKNPTKRESEFSLWDILPYKDDGRLDPLTNHEGSKTNTDLYYKTVQVDYSDSAKAQLYLTMGKGAFYYTTDKKVRTSSDLQRYDSTSNGAIKWVKLKGTPVKDSPNVYSYAVPNNAVAIKVDTLVGWEEGITINMTANVKNPDQQVVGDYYHNEARTYNGKFGYNSNVVSTLVTNLFVSGTVWVDDDNNGIMTAEEPRKDRIKVTLYQPYNPKNPLDNANLRTINGVQLVPAYDTDYYQYPTVYTDESGTFLFDDIQQGTYYVVADYIPDEYQVTVKKAGEGQGASAALDSEAETSYVTSLEPKYSEDGNTAWIKQIVVTNSSVDAQNIGLKNIRGSVKIGKTLDEIYFPSSMTDEERAEYNVPFVFVLKHTTTGATYTKQVFLNQDNMHLLGGQPQVWAEFTDLPLGTYELTESHDAQYKILDMDGNSTRVRFNAGSQKATIQITPEEYEYTVFVENGIDRDPPGGDENGVVNWVNMKIPVKLEIKYSGDAVIRNHALTEYTFSAEDFNPRAGGDMIVTYDDGSTISISEGTLRFDQVSLTPAKVTNAMNTKGGKLLTITGYYAEKGRLLSDSFRVGVDLMPIHKFDITFYSNGSAFDNGGASNSVSFIWDDQQQKNLVSGGTYKDVPNGGLKELANFTFAGWATMPDGTGTHYGTLGGGDALDALNALGMDKSYDGGELYADWKTSITFDAGASGKLTGSMTDIISGGLGQQTAVVRKSLNSKVPDTLSGSKSGYHFVMWNTKADGTGQSIKQYNEAGGVKGPITFYAIYYKSDYAYTGSVQTFTAPVSGWYKCYLWGARGGSDACIGGNGGFVQTDIHLTAGQSYYVYVGASGSSHVYNTGAGYNGAGNAGAVGKSGGGGGATDIRTMSGNWNQNLGSRIVVAGGGGGGGLHSVGGVGGGLVGGTSPGGIRGGTQTSAGDRGGFGYGGNAQVDGGGGGGGWYGGGASTGGTPSGSNDQGGGGGSSYVGGRPEANTRNMSTIAGNAYMPIPFNEGATMLGNAGACYARIFLIEYDDMTLV